MALTFMTRGVGSYWYVFSGEVHGWEIFKKQKQYPIRVVSEDSDDHFA
jgi:hypothetical protein